MYRTIVITLFILFLTVSSYSRDKVPCFKADTIFTIDASLDEWTSHPLHTFEDKLISVSARIDNDNLYLLYGTRSRQLMRIIETNGLTFWIHYKDKTDKDYGLFYIGEVGIEGMGEMPGGGPGRPDGMGDDQMTDEMKKEMEEKRERMKGKIRLTNKEGEYLLDATGADGVTAASSIYKDVYLIELKVPFKSDNESFGLPQPEKEKVAVGIEYGINFDDMKRPEGGRPGGGMRGGGMLPGGGMSGGGPPGGGNRGGGMREQMQKIKEITKEFWFSLELPKDETNKK